jgi:hypothetical protein
MPGPRYRILVLDRGNVELDVPEGWTVKPGKSGSLVLSDPADQAKIEVSYWHFGPLAEIPPVDRFLEQVASREREPPTLARSQVQAETRGNMRLATAWRSWREPDLDRGGLVREAVGWTLLAANMMFQALVTCAYWKDDEAWARPLWDRVVASILLGDGRQYRSPMEHWAMKPRN